jgi:hypothetical protein
MTHEKFDSSANSGFFPHDYLDSRTRFIDQAKSLLANHPGELSEFKIPSQTDADLTIQSVYFKAKAKPAHLLVITSGVHGPEAYTGSAVQQLFMQKIFPQIQRDDVGVLLVHAINPFGFKYHRRGTEKNINLNRGFSLHPEIFKTANQSYGNLSWLLAPTSPAGHPRLNFFEKLFHVLALAASGRLSINEFSRAAAGGQYQFANGIEFGGNEFTPQVEIMRGLLIRTAAPYRNLLFLDIHTGLGDRGRLHLITNQNIDSKDKELIAKILDPIQDVSIYKLTSVDEPGFYPTTGDLIDFASTVMKNPENPSKDTEKAVAAFTVEFGTLGASLLAKLETLNRMILENQGFHHGYLRRTDETKIKRDFLELFYPSDPLWQKQVLNHAGELLLRILDRLP